MNIRVLLISVYKSPLAASYSKKNLNVLKYDKVFAVPPTWISVKKGVVLFEVFLKKEKNVLTSLNRPQFVGPC